MAREAVIVGSLRTGLTKAHRGSFNLTEPVDYTAHVMREVVNQHPQPRQERDRGRDPGLRSSRGLHGHEHGAHRLDGGGHPADRSRDDGQPVLLVGIPGGHDGGELDPAGWRGGRGRRGRRDDHDDAGRHAEPDAAGEQDRGRALPGALLPDGDHRRDRGRALQDLPRRSGRLRAPEPAAVCRGRRGGLGPGRDRAHEGHPQGDAQGGRRVRRGGRRRQGRVQPSPDDARGTPEAEARLQEGRRGRDGHGRQRLAALGRRLRDAADVERAGQDS